MRITYKLLLAAIAALAVLAFGSTSASATSIEVEHENGNHCAPVEPCTAHVVSESPTTLETHLFGSEQVQSACNDEFVAVFNEDGTGEIHDQVLDGANCTREPCTNPGETEWVTTAPGEETGLNEITFPFEFCLAPRNSADPGELHDPADERHCIVDVIVTEVALHEYEFRVADDCDGFPTVEVDGHWTVEAGDPRDIEAMHL